MTDLALKHCCKSVSGRIDFNADPDLDPESQTNADPGQAFGVT
jgi:hypothetical protein